MKSHSQKSLSLKSFWRWYGSNFSSIVENLYLINFNTHTHTHTHPLPLSLGDGKPFQNIYVHLTGEKTKIQREKAFQYHTTISR